ncbi:MAG: hypothetical protein NC489_38215 [Ruminococcus flavefaciens]|nr:hypothetical protein [Ruminococcus flavefaciens]
MAVKKVGGNFCEQKFPPKPPSKNFIAHFQNRLRAFENAEVFEMDLIEKKFQ